MKLISTRSKVKETRDFPGLISCTMEHEVKQSTGTARFTGPYIPEEVWKKILSFFAWTYETTKSESQVRLYVNTSASTWDAWAFPQEARTGMTAKEIACPDAEAQRARFGEGWVYFGTVHHHCSASAFQSGTDESNENHQDGLHITVGNIDKAQHDLHCRFYLNGCKFDPDMSEFWPIGEELVEALPIELWDKVARFQMGKSSRVEFPTEWRTNLIEVKSVFPMGPQPGGTWVPGAGWVPNKPDIGSGVVGGGNGKVDLPGRYLDTRLGIEKTPWRREVECVAEILEELAKGGCSSEDARELFMELEASSAFDSVVTISQRHSVNFLDVMQDWDRIVDGIEQSRKMLAQDNDKLDEAAGYGGMMD